MRLYELTTPPEVNVERLLELLKGNQSRASIRKVIQYVTNALVTITSNKNVDRGNVGVNAYYDHDDDTVEISLIFNPSDTIIAWGKENREPFVHELYDALKHELLHAKQAKKRKTDYHARDEYLTNPDEVEAYAMNIADQLTRKVGVEEALHLLHNAKKSAQIKDNMGNLLSADLNAYVSGVDERTWRRLLKKIYQYLTKR